MGINCLLLIAGLSAHVGVWSVVASRPGGWGGVALVDATALALVVVRLGVRTVVPARISWFHDAWTWSGTGDELLEAIVLGPIYVLLTAVAVAVVAVRGVRRVLGGRSFADGGRGETEE